MQNTTYLKYILFYCFFSIPIKHYSSFNPQKTSGQKTLFAKITKNNKIIIGLTVAAIVSIGILYYCYKTEDEKEIVEAPHIIIENELKKYLFWII